MTSKNAVFQRDAGASMIEYVLLAALISIVCVIALTFLGAQASQSFSIIGSSIGTANVS